MRKRSYLLTFGLVLVALFAFAGVASADPPNPQDADPHSQNVHPMGHDLDPASLLNPNLPPDIHSDLAFWGQYAFQGNYDGFRILDISAPGNPKLFSRTFCNGNQGDIVVWGNILVRSWNSPAPTGRECDGQPVPAGFEGVHIFDISDLNDPVLVGAVETVCGSHTATIAPDLTNNRLIVYSNVSGGCDWIDIINVPLDNPGGASLIGTEPLVGGSLGGNNGCHDMGVFLADVNLAVCASGHAANVFDIGDNAFPGGSLEDPAFLYNIEEADSLGNQVGVGGRWHSASFTWDGQVIVLGWEPGGGGAPECEATDPDIKKSAFFYDAATGAKLGQWTLPRPQTALENCTLHNYNVVPVRSGNYVFVHGSYQSGTSVVDFTDPANPVEVGYTDPPPLDPFDIGGAWSSYWYNNFMYESNITEGLNIFRLSDNVTAGAMRLPYLNPQTQDFTIP